MAHIITIEVEKGYTEDCSICPFGVEGDSNEGFLLCGKPEQFLDCDDVNYAEMLVINN